MIKLRGLLYAGLEILAFPCNQFGAQEPGTNEEILEFVCTRFKAEFPIFDKVGVILLLTARDFVLSVWYLIKIGVKNSETAQILWRY